MNAAGLSGYGRMADALLRTLGGRTVLLRIALPAVAGDPGEQVGLGVPLFEDVVLGPVAFRRGVATEMLVSATAVEGIVGSLAFESAAVLFAQAAGVLVDGVLWRVTEIAQMEAFGAVYLYRVKLVGAVGSAV